MLCSSNLQSTKNGTQGQIQRGGWGLQLPYPHVAMKPPLTIVAMDKKGIKEKEEETEEREKEDREDEPFPLKNPCDFVQEHLS